MNIIFLSIVLIAFAAAGWHQLAGVPIPGHPSPMEALSRAMVDSAAGSVELAFGLIGVMTLFLGLMKVAEKGGLLTVIARLIRPLMARLFPEVPAEHPAMGAMILNMSANVLGLGNAATPFGIRAMQELNRLNPAPGTATDAMALFLAINTSSVTVLPTGVIALRAAAGSADPAGILPTTLFATACSTATAIIAVMLLRRLTRKPLPCPADAPPADEGPAEPPEVLPDTAQGAYPAWASALALAGILTLIPVTVAYGRSISPWILPGLMAGFLLFGLLRRVRVYEAFVDGAKDGFQVAVSIIPYLIAILVAISVFRTTGCMDFVVGGIGAVVVALGLNADFVPALPVGLMKTLSGSGARGLMVDVMTTYGVDSFQGKLAAIIQGSTETTFYVLAVYFGSVNIRKTRYALACGLFADLVGVVAAILLAYAFFR
jgi:spore maturation protein SpmA